MTVEEIKEKYPYLYETHLHTSSGSACGHNTGAEMARALKEYGYTGAFVTDHNWGGNTCVDRSLPWKEWVNQFFQGYRDMKEEGDRIGLQVFSGWEAGYSGPEFLIYGLTPEWMETHEELHTASPSEQYKMVHEAGGMVLQAHPYREEWYIDEVRLFPDDVDGCEIINATHSCSKSKSHFNPEFNTRAIAYAKEHDFCTSAGSDIHSTNIFGGGMAFPTKLKDDKDFMKRVLNKEDYVVTDGDHWYTRTGDLLV